MGTVPFFRIGPPEPGQEAEALELAFAELDPEERAQQIALIRRQAGTANRPPEGPYVAIQSGRLLGAIYWQLQPGKTGMIWPPGLRGGDQSAAGQLIQAACESLTAHGAHLVQCLLRPGSAPATASLEAAGFEHLAELYYMASLTADFPQSPPSTQLVFESYAPDAHARFAAVLEATYEGTQDCPVLNGARAIDDVLAGYRASGEFDPGRWLFVRHGGRDVGCLILADYPEQNNFELVYMGVVPEARGNRWGAGIARYAQWRARSAGRERLVLAVDAANEPALGMYGRVGFRVWDRRSVWVKVFTRRGKS